MNKKENKIIKDLRMENEDLKSMNISAKKIIEDLKKENENLKNINNSLMASCLLGFTFSGNPIPDLNCPPPGFKPYSMLEGFYAPCPEYYKAIKACQLEHMPSKCCCNSLSLEKGERKIKNE